MTTDTVLLCASLDRTLLPNGGAEESSPARPVFRQVAERPEIELAYASGGDLAFLCEALEQYELPTPRYAICDVGTAIHERTGDGWRAWDDWTEQIAAEWNGIERGELEALFADLESLSLQGPSQQKGLKLSYVSPVDFDIHSMEKELRMRLQKHGCHAAFVWSRDVQDTMRRLDIVPERGTKVDAIRYIMERTGHGPFDTVVAGASGSDLDLLGSGLRAVAVGNASDDVKYGARTEVLEKGIGDQLYVAHGDFHGMNGNYVAGVLEGLAYFVAPADAWIREALETAGKET
ncbi:MAG: HAD family hydrolase [Candidatus Eiseniibacteriota bacterium]|jgi:hydroxymethylpyrimidine pyrophosphatase-like HAD family hydrolase